MPYTPQIFIYNDTEDGDNFESLLVDTSVRKSQDIYADYLKNQANPPQATAISGSQEQSDHTGLVVYGLAIVTVGALLARSFCRGKLFKAATQVEKNSDACPERQVMITKPRS